MKNTILKWWKWHRAAMWGAVASVPAAWVGSIQFQQYFPPHIVSVLGIVIGTLGFISEMQHNLGKNK